MTKDKELFHNLRTALMNKEITVKKYADILCVGEKTVRNKLSGKTDFTFEEVIKTCSLLSEYSADFLFAK